MKKIIISIAALLIFGYFGYNYVMAAPEEIATSKADFTLNTIDFSKEFSTNQALADKKYAEKVISLNGKVTEVEPDGITLNKTIYCKLKSTKSINVGDTIKIKGLFIGYDELLEIVKLDQCTLVK
ncbi:MAG: hypothetical protein V3U80_02425 [Flavobacteriaceae bacterium]